MTDQQDRPVPQYLWLTRFFPYPSHAGDLIYSAKLIEALANQDCHVTAFCTYADPLPSLESPARQVDWVTCREGSGHRMWLYPVSPLPRQALRLSAPNASRALRNLLTRRKWDAILIDYVSMGWTLPLLAQAARTMRHRPGLVYIAHNHEASLRRLACSNSTASLPLRLAQQIDGRRVAALEHQLLTQVDLVTTVSSEVDQVLFKADAPEQRYLNIVPGYGGPRLLNRTLTANTPRRVIVVGSFDWIVKQQNLTEFLEAAAAPLTAHGIGIDIVGSGPAGLFDSWRRRFPNVAIHGRVDAVEPYLQNARISLIPERIGGGFKTKVLNAVFQRSPVFALTGSVTEMPLADGKSYRLFPDFPALVEGIIEYIDDLNGLNALQEAAYRACQDGFHWQDRGFTLHKALMAISPSPKTKNLFPQSG